MLVLKKISHKDKLSLRRSQFVFKEEFFQKQTSNKLDKMKKRKKFISNLGSQRVARFTHKLAVWHSACYFHLS